MQEIKARHHKDSISEKCCKERIRGLQEVKNSQSVKILQEEVQETVKESRAWKKVKIK